MIQFLPSGTLQSPLRCPLLPYQRVATSQVLTGDDDSSYCVQGYQFFAASGSICASYGLKSMAKVWRFTIPNMETSNGISVGAGCLCLTTKSEHTRLSHLYCLDPATGKVRWSVVSNGPKTVATVSGDMIYANLAPLTVSALDRFNHKVKWTRTLSRSEDKALFAGFVDALAADKDGVAASAGGVTYVLKASTGQIVHSQSDSYLFHSNIVVTSGAAIVPAGCGTAALSLKTGKKLWQSKAWCSDFRTLFEGLFVCLGDDVLTAIDPQTGHTVWWHKLGPEAMGGNQYLAPLGGRLFVRGLFQAGIYDKHGNALWTGSDDSALPAPLWSDGIHLVSFDGQRLLRYVRAPEPAIPSNREARSKLAAKLIKQFDKLDRVEVDRVTRLGAEAFKPTLAAFFVHLCSL